MCVIILNDLIVCVEPLVVERGSAVASTLLPNNEHIKLQSTVIVAFQASVQYQ